MTEMFLRIPSGENISDSPDIRIDVPPYNKTDDDEPVKGQVNRVYITMLPDNGLNEMFVLFPGNHKQQI